MALEQTTGLELKERGQSPVIYVVGAVIMLALVAVAVLVSRSGHVGNAASKSPPLGTQERAYAQQIHIQNTQMARSTNFLNQEFTYVSGTVSNDGDRTLQSLELTLEFHDPFDQLILREKKQVIASPGEPLASGQKRDFQITLEHIPPEWNQQYPTIRLTGMVLK